MNSDYIFFLKYPSSFCVLLVSFLSSLLVLMGLGGIMFLSCQILAFDTVCLSMLLVSFCLFVASFNTFVFSILCERSVLFPLSSSLLGRCSCCVSESR